MEKLKTYFSFTNQIRELALDDFIFKIFQILKNLFSENIVFQVLEIQDLYSIFQDLGSGFKLCKVSDVSLKSLGSLIYINL